MYIKIELDKRACWECIDPKKDWNITPKRLPKPNEENFFHLVQQNLTPPKKIKYDVSLIQVPVHEERVQVCGIDELLDYSDEDDETEEPAIQSPHQSFNWKMCFNQEIFSCFPNIIIDTNLEDIDYEDDENVYVSDDGNVYEDAWLFPNLSEALSKAEDGI